MASETIANGTTEILHRLDLTEYGLEDVPQESKAVAKKDVADYLANQILREVNSGRSPVQGEGRFKRLEPEYSLREKGGSRLSDLENEGDLLNDFKVSLDDGPFLEVGHKGSQTPKADGHNQLSSKAKTWARKTGFPRRRYIPDDGQTFTKPIVSEIREIIGEYKVLASNQEALDLSFGGGAAITTADQTSTTTTDLFGDDVIDALLEDALARGV